MSIALQDLRVAIAKQSVVDMDRLFGRRTPNVSLKEPTLAVEPGAAVKRGPHGLYACWLDGEPIVASWARWGYSTASEAWYALACHLRDREASKEVA